MSPRKKTDPRDVARLWEELEQVCEERKAAEAAKTEASRRATDLNVALLKAGVQRAALIGRPFTAAHLTTIQERAGLTRRQMQEKKEQQK